MSTSSQSTYAAAIRGFLLFLLVMAGLVAAFVHRPFRAVSYSELLQFAEPSYHATLITTTVYCGSKDGFDYFIVRPVDSFEKRYRVDTSDGPAALTGLIIHRIPVVGLTAFSISPCVERRTQIKLLQAVLQRSFIGDK